MDIVAQRIFIPLLMLVALFLAIILGVVVSEGRYVEMGLGLAALCGVIWAVVGQKVWWLPIFFFMTLGGFFHVGFRIFSHELAVLLCLTPMILALAMNKKEINRDHMAIPMLVVVLFIYLCLHFMGMMVYLKLNNLPGLGNIIRRYADAIWPFLILVPFLWVGRTKYIHWVLHLIAIAAFIRFAFVFAYYFTDQQELIYVPGLNFVPAGAGSPQDLRFSGSILTMIGVCYFCLTRNPIIKILVIPMIALGIFGTFLGGGRITVVLLMGVFGFAFLIYKNYAAIFAWFGAMLSIVMVLNVAPDLLHHFPERAKRAASAFLIDRDFAAEVGETSASDEWHARLQEAGFESWTQNLFTFFFGRGTRQFEERAWQEGENFEGMVEMATLTSRFEKGLWDVLATFGLFGFILYALLMIKIIRTCLPILFRDRIATPLHAIMFIAVYWCVTWFLLCWIMGTFPSEAILFGVVAMVAAHDLQLAEAKERQIADAPQLPELFRPPQLARSNK